MTAAFETALDFAQQGYSVFPTFTIGIDGRCTCGGRPDCKPGKHPITAHGWQNASIDERQLLRWNDRWPEANWAVHCDRAAVIDIDPKSGADPREIIFDHDLGHRPGVWSGVAPEPGAGGKYPNSLSDVRGVHIYCAGGGRGGATSIAGVEIRGCGLYVLVPGSRHLSGVSYEWINDARPWNVTLKPIPVALAPTSAGKSDYTPPMAGERVPHGGRHNHLTDFACRLASARVLDEATMVDHLKLEFRVRCAPNPAPAPGSIEAIARWAVSSEIARRERDVQRAGVQRGEHLQDDALREVPAATYLAWLAPDGCYGCGGVLRPIGATGWYCPTCPPRQGAGKRYLGGTIYQLAALLAGYDLPLRGATFRQLRNVLVEGYVARVEVGR